eukprot:NP_510406.2 Uncharacterized protein CELE_M163.6 [Caenorhabditis elegans]
MNGHFEVLDKEMASAELLEIVQKDNHSGCHHVCPTVVREADAYRVGPGKDICFGYLFHIGGAPTDVIGVVVEGMLTRQCPLLKKRLVSAYMTKNWSLGPSNAHFHDADGDEAMEFYVNHFNSIIQHHEIGEKVELESFVSGSVVVRSAILVLAEKMLLFQHSIFGAPSLYQYVHNEIFLEMFYIRLPN